MNQPSNGASSPSDEEYLAGLGDVLSSADWARPMQRITWRPTRPRAMCHRGLRCSEAGEGDWMESIAPPHVTLCGPCRVYTRANAYNYDDDPFVVVNLAAQTVTRYSPDGEVLSVRPLIHGPSRSEVVDPHDEIATLRARIADIERRAAGGTGQQPPGPGLSEAIERHYMDPPADEAERRRQRADERKAYGFEINEPMEQTLRIADEHPDEFHRLPGDIQMQAAYYAEMKAAAERVNADKEEAR